MIINKKDYCTDETQWAYKLGRAFADGNVPSNINVPAPKMRPRRRLLKGEILQIHSLSGINYALIEHDALGQCTNIKLMSNGYLIDRAYMSRSLDDGIALFLGSKGKSGVTIDCLYAFIFGSHPWTRKLVATTSYI